MSLDSPGIKAGVPSGTKATDQPHSSGSSIINVVFLLKPKLLVEKNKKNNNYLFLQLDLLNKPKTIN